MKKNVVEKWCPRCNRMSRHNYDKETNCYYCMACGRFEERVKNE